MFCPIRNVFALVVVGGLAWSCGGDRVTTSIAPEVDPSAEGVNPATRQVYGGQPLGKLAVSGYVRQAVVVAMVRQDGAPLSGVTVEFSRSVSGLPANYSWSGSTDASGEARVEIGEAMSAVTIRRVLFRMGPCWVPGPAFRSTADIR